MCYRSSSVVGIFLNAVPKKLRIGGLNDFAA